MQSCRTAPDARVPGSIASLRSFRGGQPDVKVIADMGRWSRKLAVVFAAGYILFFYSERVFWSFLRPGDRITDILITWVV